MGRRDTVVDRFEEIWHDLKNAYYGAEVPPQTHRELCSRLSGDGTARLREFAHLFEILDALYEKTRAPSFPLDRNHISPLSDSTGSRSSEADFLNALKTIAEKYEEEYGREASSTTSALTIGPSGPRANLALALKQSDPSDFSSRTATDISLLVWTDSSALSASIYASLSLLLDSQNLEAVSISLKVLQILHAASPDKMVRVWIDDEEAELFTHPRCPTPSKTEVSWEELPSSPAKRFQITPSTLVTDLLPLC